MILTERCIVHALRLHLQDKTSKHAKASKVHTLPLFAHSSVFQIGSEGRVVDKARQILRQRRL